MRMRLPVKHTHGGGGVETNRTADMVPLPYNAPTTHVPDAIPTGTDIKQLGKLHGKFGTLAGIMVVPEPATN